MNQAAAPTSASLVTFGVKTGDVIAGKFRVDSVLGEGAMGLVVLATNLQMDEQFALKLLRPEMATDREFVSRFAREAKACARIKSEHVARVHDVGVREDGLPFIVMEYLQGRDLGVALEESGVLAVTDAAEYIIQACEALAQAHARGIVHRDIKPENLFLVTHAEGWSTIKVLDFGISKAALMGGRAFDEDVDLAKTSVLMGTPLYMSPEQLRNAKSVDSRSDIWALGVVLYEILTGRNAFYGDSLPEVTASILEAPCPVLGDARPDAPCGLEMVIERCLEKDPSKRFQNVAELAIALLPFAPRRARVPAERSTSVIRSAGLSSPDLKFPASVFPPPGPNALVPSFAPTSSLSTTALASSRHVSNDSATQARSNALPGDKRRSRLGLLTGVLGALAIGAATFFLLKRSAPHQDASFVDSETAPAAPGVAAAAEQTATSLAVAAATRADAASSVLPITVRPAGRSGAAPSTVGFAASNTSAIAPRRPAPSATAKPTATAVAPRTSADPDIGY